MSNRIKPLPYLVLQDSYPHYHSASWLRGMVADKLSRKLPTLHYSGWRHGFVPRYIKQQRAEYPHYLVADIQKFYPSIPHSSLVVSGQLAYKYLSGCSFVPSSFSKPFVSMMQGFFSTLPLTSIGIPVGSALSSAVAPLFWVPLLQGYKESNELRFMVFADDIFVMGRSNYSIEKAYHLLCNYVVDNGMSLSLHKVVQGRWGRSPFSFCGYRFAGGYVSVDEAKVAGFMERTRVLIRKKRKTPLSLMKRLNHQIDGFGHYYKDGSVGRLYERLDTFIRQELRRSCGRLDVLEKTTRSLHRLENIKERHKRSIRATQPKPKIVKSYRLNPTEPRYCDKGDTLLYELIEQQKKVVEQNKTIITLLKKMLSGQTQFFSSTFG